MKNITIPLLIIILSACSIREQVVEDESPQSFSFEQSLFSNTISSISLSETGDVEILDVKAVVEKEIVSSLFILDAPIEGGYYLSLFMMPEDKSTYRIECNGEPVEGVLAPQKAGWQTIPFMNENRELSQIPLKRGKNEVSVFSSSNDFPEISVFKMSLSPEKTDVSTEAYDEYIRKIVAGKLSTPEIQTVTTKANSTLNPVDYQYQLGCPLLYSFTKTIVGTIA